MTRRMTVLYCSPTDDHGPDRRADARPDPGRTATCSAAGEHSSTASVAPSPSSRSLSRSVSTIFGAAGVEQSQLGRLARYVVGIGRCRRDAGQPVRRRAEQPDRPVPVDRRPDATSPEYQAAIAADPRPARVRSGRRRHGSATPRPAIGGSSAPTGRPAYVVVRLNATDEQSVDLVDGIRLDDRRAERLHDPADRLRAADQGRGRSIERSISSAPRSCRCRSPP